MAGAVVTRVTGSNQVAITYAIDGVEKRILRCSWGFAAENMESNCYQCDKGRIVHNFASVVRDL